MVASLLLLSLAALTAVVSARDLCVRSTSCTLQFATIQDALNAAQADDRVLVAAGEYAEALQLPALPSLTLASISGANVTFLVRPSAPAQYKPAISNLAAGSPPCRLRVAGFTLLNHLSMAPNAAAAIDLACSSPSSISLDNMAVRGCGCKYNQTACVRVVIGGSGGRGGSGGANSLLSLRTVSFVNNMLPAVGLLASVPSGSRSTFNATDVEVLNTLGTLLPALENSPAPPIAGSDAMGVSGLALYGFHRLVLSDLWFAVNGGSGLLVDSSVANASVLVSRLTCTQNRLPTATGACLAINADFAAVEDSQLVQNAVKGRGGAIRWRGSRGFELRRSLLDLNTALSGGGALALIGGTGAGASASPARQLAVRVLDSSLRRSNSAIIGSATAVELWTAAGAAVSFDGRGSRVPGNGAPYKTCGMRVVCLGLNAFCTVVVANYVSTNAGALVVDAESDGWDVRLVNSSIQGTQAEPTIGIVAVSGVGTLTIEDSIFRDNFGPLVVRYASDDRPPPSQFMSLLRVRRCTFVNVRLKDSSASRVIYAGPIKGVAAGADPAIVVEDSVFNDNDRLLDACPLVHLRDASSPPRLGDGPACPYNQPWTPPTRPPLAVFRRCGFTRGFVNGTVCASLTRCGSVTGIARVANSTFSCTISAAGAPSCADYVVSAATGSDLAVGTADLPLQTIGAAVARVVYQSVQPSNIWLVGGSVPYAGAGNTRMDVKVGAADITFAAVPGRGRPVVRLTDDEFFLSAGALQTTVRIVGVDFRGDAQHRTRDGAGVLRMAADLRVTNCSFVGTGATAGGAISVGITGSQTTAVIEDSLFFRVRSSSGAIVCTDGGRLVIDRCRFVHNAASVSGAAISGMNCVSVSVLRSEFVDNRAQWPEIPIRGFFSEGGAIAMASRLPGTTASLLTISGSRFERNIADKGGAINAKSTMVLADTSQFVAHTKSLSGGAVFLGAESQAVFTQCQLSFNSADVENFGQRPIDPRFRPQGGAIYVEDTKNRMIRLSQCQFENNVAATEGGAVFCSNSLCVLEDSYFWRNSAANGGAVGVTGTDGELGLVSSRFDSNGATQLGGGAWIDALVFGVNSTFVNNRVSADGPSFGGGMGLTGFAWTRPDQPLGYFLFSANTASNMGGCGGGLAAMRSSFNEAQQTEITSSVFEYNLADGAGGGVYVDTGAVVLISNSSFVKNQVPSGQGGGAYVMLLSFSYIKQRTPLLNVWGEGNAARAGGGVACDYRDVNRFTAPSRGIAIQGFSFGYGADLATQPVRWTFIPYKIPSATAIGGVGSGGNLGDQQIKDVGIGAELNFTTGRPGHPLPVRAKIFDALDQRVNWFPGGAFAAHVSFTVDDVAKSRNPCPLKQFPSETVVFETDGYVAIYSITMPPVSAACNVTLLLSSPGAGTDFLQRIALPVEIQGCLPGEGFLPGTGCVPCSAGEATTARGFAACSPCVDDRLGRAQYAPFAKTGGSSCFNCPFNAQNGTTRATLGDCVCPDRSCAVPAIVRAVPGDSGMELHHTLCASCDATLENRCSRSAWETSLCPQGSWFAPAAESMANRSDYVRYGRILACPYPPACAANFTCAEGYDGDGVCGQCPSSGARVAAFIGVLLVLVAFCLYSANKTLVAVASERTERSPIVPLLKIARDWAVTTLLFASLSANWTQEMRDLVGVESWLGLFAAGQAGGASQIASLRSLDCMLALIGDGADPVLARLLAALLFPLLAIALQLAVVSCLRGVQLSLHGRQRQGINADAVPTAAAASSSPPSGAAETAAAPLTTRRSASRAAAAAVLAFMPGASAADAVVLVTIVTVTAQQFAVVRVFLEPFVCVDANGTRYLAQDTDVVCGSGRHHTLLALAVLGLMVYAVAFPAALFVALVRSRHHLADVQVLRRFSYVYSGYQPRAFFFELVLAGRRLLLSLLVSLIPFSSTQFFRLGALALVFAAAGVLHLHVQPFRAPLLNRLEFASLSTSFLTLSLASFLTDRSISSGGRVFVTLLVCAVHAVFLLMLIAALVSALGCCRRLQQRASKSSLMPRALTESLTFAAPSTSTSDEGEIDAVAGLEGHRYRLLS